MSLLDSNSEIYFLALALLHVLRDEDDFSDVSRLALILDRENFDRLIDNCGGMTVTIPTRSEVNELLKSLLFYQLRYLRHNSWNRSMELSGVSPEDAKAVSSVCKRINRYFRKINPNIYNSLSMVSIGDDDDD